MFLLINGTNGIRDTRKFVPQFSSSWRYGNKKKIKRSIWRYTTIYGSKISCSDQSSWISKNLKTPHKNQHFLQKPVFFKKEFSFKTIEDFAKNLRKFGFKGNFRCSFKLADSFQKVNFTGTKFGWRSRAPSLKSSLPSIISISS